MFSAIAILVVYIAAIWLVFFKFKWLRFSMAWGVVSVLFGVHILLIFLIGVRYVAPSSYRAVVIQHTVQLVPRLPDPTILMEVLVDDNVPVKKGQPLFKFDTRPYEFKVKQLEAQLVAAKQNAQVLVANVDVAIQTATGLKSRLDYATFRKGVFDKLAKEGTVKADDVQTYENAVAEAKASYLAAEGDLTVKRLQAASEIDGVNTAVAALEAELGQARYYLEQTTIYAPADGRIINLQAREGMVAGIVRFGSIAALVIDDDRYILGAFRQENLKFVKSGQPVEIALDLYPGQIFKGTVDSIWWGTGQGQLLPTSEIPTFTTEDSRSAEGLFAVKIRLNASDQSQFPIGAQGVAAIYTGDGGFAALRRVSVRAYSWLNWLFPIPD